MMNIRKSIELNRDNIAEWKRQLNNVMRIRAKIDGYAETCDDEQWIDLFEGNTPTDVFVDYCTTE